MENKINNSAAEVINFYGDRAYVKLEKIGDKYEFYINNEVTGWIWSGGNEELLGFFITINNSTIWSEILKQLRKIPFSEFKQDLLKAVKDGDGLYELTGGNDFWLNCSNRYEEFLNEYKDIYIKEMTLIIQESKSYKDFVNKLDEYQDIIDENLFLFLNEKEMV